MPHRTEIIHGGTGLLRVWEGEVPVGEMLEAARNFVALFPEPERLSHAIMDLSGVSGIDFELQDLKALLRITGRAKAL